MGYHVDVPQLAVKDASGRIHQFHQGAVVPWLSDVDAARLQRLGMVHDVGGTHRAASASAAAPDAAADDADDSVDVGGRPRQVAPKEAWVDYGVGLGHDRAALEAMTKADLVAQLS